MEFTLPDQFQQAGTHWSKRFMEWLKARDLGEESGNRSLSLLIEEAEFIRSLVLKATRKINELSRSKRF